MDPDPYFFFFAGVIIYVFESFHFNADWYNYLFPVFLYPFAEIAQCSSIYMTVAIAVERFIGLCRPFRRLSSRPCPAKAYILPGNQEVFVLLTIDWNISWRSILILMWLGFQMGSISSRIMQFQMKDEYFTGSQTLVKGASKTAIKVPTSFTNISVRYN